jgi:hypothetical protein
MICGNAANGLSSHLALITTIVMTALTAVTAIFVAVIGYFQYCVNKAKLRLDLYNRRFEIYSHAVDLYQALLVWDASDSAKSVQRGFIKSQFESRFLFDPKDGIYELLVGMNGKSSQIIDLITNLIKKQGGNLTQVPDELSKALNGFVGDIRNLEKRMSTYLNFHKISG